ncbi:MAG TPA: excinuclease ATPase subunit [Albitalea sp.]|nr:excinuclease ATPase subunit [Albitalea sp.]
MKKTWILGLAAALLAVPALARDEAIKLSFADLLESAQAKGKLDGSVKFYLAGQKTPKIIERKGEDISNKKTNGFNKDVTTGCQWAALAALIAFQDKAKQMGANAVVDIVSYYKRETFTSATEYECHDGAFVTGVTLKGTYAKVAK